MGDGIDLQERIHALLHAHPNAEFSDQGIQGLLFTNHALVVSKEDVQQTMDELVETDGVEISGWAGTSRTYRIKE